MEPSRGNWQSEYQSNNGLIGNSVTLGGNNNGFILGSAEEATNWRIVFGTRKTAMYGVRHLLKVILLQQLDRQKLGLFPADP
jgi:hypothetical protein